MTITRRRALGALATAAALAVLPAAPAAAASAETIDARVNVALGRLYEEVPYARELAERAKAILIMPRVVKGSFVVGGAYGEGALRLNDGTGAYPRTDSYYSVAAGSVGLQIGFQKTSHALFFLTDSALERFRRSDGWEIGADAEVTFPEAGLNAAVNSTTAERPIIGVVFSEDGLAIGASLEGAKYSRINR
jgi:lipid-binding SYLF domain-containing protein